MIRLVIPWEHLASSNQRNSRRGGRGHGWGYKRSLKAIHAHALTQTQPPRPMYPDQAVTMQCRFHPPDRRRRDVANYLKGLQDALEGACYTDDWQVVRTEIERDETDRERPRVEITIQEVESDE